MVWGLLRARLSARFIARETGLSKSAIRNIRDYAFTGIKPSTRDRITAFYQSHLIDGRVVVSAKEYARCHGRPCWTPEREYKFRATYAARRARA